MIDVRATGVWIDSEKALIIRWHKGVIARQIIESQIPVHQKSTGHISEGGGERYGGTGPRATWESHRLEHRRSFLSEVAGALPVDEDLYLLGDGVVVEHLGAALRVDDVAHNRLRRVAVRRHAPLTEPQLVEQLRRFAGDPPRRRMPTARSWQSTYIEGETPPPHDTGKAGRRG